MFKTDKHCIKFYHINLTWQYKPSSTLLSNCCNTMQVEMPCKKMSTNPSKLSKIFKVTWTSFAALSFQFHLYDRDFIFLKKNSNEGRPSLLLVLFFFPVIAVFVLVTLKLQFFPSAPCAWWLFPEILKRCHPYLSTSCIFPYLYCVLTLLNKSSNRGIAQQW